jgi:hypothetical protein
MSWTPQRIDPGMEDGRWSVSAIATVASDRWFTAAWPSTGGIPGQKPAASRFVRRVHHASPIFVILEKMNAVDLSSAVASIKYNPRQGRSGQRME